MENQNKDLFGQINHIKQDKLRIEHDLKLAQNEIEATHSELQLAKN